MIFQICTIETLLQCQTGQTGGGALALLWCNGVLNTIWFIITVWLVFVLIADGLWCGGGRLLVYRLRIMDLRL